MAQKGTIVQVTNGQHLRCLPPTQQPTSLRDFLLTAPRGAYTTGLVKDAFSITEWELHVARLVKSIAAMHGSIPGFFDVYYRWLMENATAAEHVVIAAVTVPSILAALEHSTQIFRETDDRILTIIISPGGVHPLDVNVAVGPSIIRNRLDSVPNIESLGPFAVILGPPRQIPVGKDSGWVRQREYLEGMRPIGATEILLCHPTGHLLEGLVTNFYVIIAKKEPDANGIVLQTAGIGDGVVWGITRWRVLEACSELGIRVEEAAPDPAMREQWTECFLTNSLRGIEPLSRIVCDSKNVWGLAPWETRMQGGHPGRWTSAIKAKVDAAVKASAVDVRSVHFIALTNW